MQRSITVSKIKLSEISYGTLSPYPLHVSVIFFSLLMLKNKFYFILESIDLKYEINAILLLAPCVQLEGYKNMGIFNILQIVIGSNSHLILNEDIWNPANHFEILFGFGSTEKCIFFF